MRQTERSSTTQQKQSTTHRTAGPQAPPHKPREPRGRPGGGRPGARATLHADCAVGSGEWAEPPHSPWTLRRRVQKNAFFGRFSGPEDRAKKGTFRSSFGPPFWTLYPSGRRPDRLIIAALLLRRSRPRHDAEAYGLADGQGPLTIRSYVSRGHPFRTERWPGVQRSRCRLWTESGLPSRASIRVAQRRRHHGIEVCRSSVLSDRRSPS